MILLTRQQALKVQGRIYKTIDVPELGGSLRLASLGAGPALAVNAFKERKARGEDVDREMMILLFTASIVDAESVPLFDEASAGEFLDRMSVETLQQIVNEIPKGKEAPPAGNSVGSPPAA